MSRRLVPVAAGALIVAAFSGLLMGSSTIVTVVIVPLVAVVGIGVVQRRSGSPDGRWSAVPSAATATGAGVEPAVRFRRGSRRQVSAALGRVESRELALSGWFGAGLGLLIVALLVLEVLYGDENGNNWREAFGISAWLAHPLAGLVIIGVHRLVSRPGRARDGAAELFESCPTSQQRRNFAVVRTAVVPLTAFAVYAVLFGAATLRYSPATHGPIRSEVVAVLVTSFALLVGAVVLGVAIGSWTRFAVAPVIAVVAVGFLSARIATVGDPGWNGLAVLSTVGPSVASPLLYPLVRPWLNLAWVVELTALVAVVALLRFRRDRVVWLAGAGLAALAVLTAVVAVSPVDPGAADAVANRITHPDAVQTCTTPPGTRVEVCTYPEYGELHERIIDAVAPIARVLPPEAAVTLRQRLDATMEDLPPEVRRRVDHLPITGADEIPIGYDGERTRLLSYRLLVAFDAVGVTFQDGDFGAPVVFSGQARSVVAMWLATRGLDPDAALDLSNGYADGDDAFERGLAWPSMCGPAVWSAQDLAAAQQLIRLPEARVLAVVRTDFGRWSDPDTGTNELLAELGLPAAGPYDKIISRTESYC